MDALQEQHDEAAAALISADANDPAVVARTQAAIRLFRAFIDGEVREGIEYELKEKELSNG